jgi:hypothetical protein
MKSAPTALERRSTRPTRPHQAESQPPSRPDGHPETETETERSTVERSEKKPRPYKEVWLVEDRRDGRSIWTRVGVAFENTDGSWNIRLSALPVGSGRLNMRNPMEREAHGAQRVAA